MDTLIKRMDHTERARRENEAPLLQEAYAQKVKVSVHTVYQIVMLPHALHPSLCQYAFSACAIVCTGNYVSGTIVMLYSVARTNFPLQPRGQFLPGCASLAAKYNVLGLLRKSVHVQIRACVNIL